MTPFLSYLALAIACTAADLVTTWLVTPDLRYERNPIIRWLGWRWSIVSRLSLCLFSALMGGIYVAILCVASIMCAAWNARIIYRMRR